MGYFDAPTMYNYQFFKPLKSIYVGTVVANDDPKTMGRVKVEIPGLTLGIDKDHLPWYHCMQPTGLGGSFYSQALFGIPQVNTQVVVMFPTEDIYAGLVIGTLINRSTFPADQLNLSADYLHPTGSEHHFTENWDKVDETSSNQKHFSPDMAEDYPGCWGWVDNALNWFKVNMFKRTVEFVTNSFTKFKNYANGDTVIHITGNLKLVVEKDFYLEVRGNTDFIHFNSKYEHVIGNYIILAEHMLKLEGKRETKIKGKETFIN